MAPIRASTGSSVLLHPPQVRPRHGHRLAPTRPSRIALARPLAPRVRCVLGQDRDSTSSTPEGGDGERSDTLGLESMSAGQELSGRFAVRRGAALHPTPATDAPPPKMVDLESHTVQSRARGPAQAEGESGRGRRRQPQPQAQRDAAPELLNYWWPLAHSSSVVEDRPSSAALFGEPLVLYRDRDGAIVCAQDRCIHKSCPLSLGYACLLASWLACLPACVRACVARARMHSPLTHRPRWSDARQVRRGRPPDMWVPRVGVRLRGPAGARALLAPLPQGRRARVPLPGGNERAAPARITAAARTALRLSAAGNNHCWSWAGGAGGQRGVGLSRGSEQDARGATAGAHDPALAQGRGDARLVGLRGAPRVELDAMAGRHDTPGSVPP
eukprot:scaffold614_cov367-Prasinococcus_capsulatus_cf.AAC.34